MLVFVKGLLTKQWNPMPDKNSKFAEQAEDKRKIKDKREEKGKGKNGRGGQGEERKNNSWYMSRKSNMMSRRKNQLSEQNVGQSTKERVLKCISLTNMVK